MNIWTTVTDELIDYLVTLIDGRSVLEVFAGYGEVGERLAARGVDVKSTSVFMECYDGSAFDMPARVESLDAVSACIKYRGCYDLLLAAWPIADDTLLHCALEWEKPILCIGELWHKHPDNEHGFYSGTASDSYYENVDDIVQPRVGLPAGGAVMFHKLKETLKSGFSPYLLMSGWSDRQALLRLYNQRVG